MQKKKHLLLLNRIMRAELKKDIIPVPSKLTEEEVNQYFQKLFVKKDDYYVPIKNKVSLDIDEELFKDLIKKKKTLVERAEEKMTEKEMKKEKDKEMAKSIALSIYKKFENDYVKPFSEKKRANQDYIKEQNLMIDKYIKYGKNVRDIIEEKLPKTWAAILNPAFLEREKRKEGLIEEEMKLKDTIKKEVKKNEVKEEPSTILDYDKLASELQGLIYITNINDISKALYKLNFRGKIQTNKILLNLQILQNFKTAEQIKLLIDELKKYK